MNLLDAVVTKVLSEPKYVDEYAKDGITWWEVKVEYDCWGQVSEGTLTCKTEDEAKEIKVGYEFLT